MVDGIDVDGLEPFIHSFPNDYYAILPVLEESLPILHALGLRELCASWTSSARQGHCLFIADSDFTPGGVRTLMERLKDEAEREGTLVKHSSNGVHEKLSEKVRARLRAELLPETDTWQPKREALAAWLIQRFWPGRDFRAQAVNSHGSKFNVMNANGTYAAYSIDISSQAPFKVRILKMEKVNGRWVSKEVLRQTFNPRT